MKRLSFLSALLVLIAGFANAQHFISGNVLYHQNPEYPIEGVQVELINEDGIVISQTLTDFDGFYSFSNIPSGSYTVKVSTDLPGIRATMAEAMLILQHLNGTYTLNDMEFMAADVDGNGAVNFADFMFIMINHFIFNQPFPAGNWAFESIQVLAGSKEGNQGIGGSRIGDVEGVWIPTGRDLFEHFEPVISNSIRVAEGDLVTIPLKVMNPSQLISGYGLVLNYDPAVLEIVDVNAFGEDVQFHISENEVRLAWISSSSSKVFNGELLTVQVRMKVEGDGSFPFVIGNESHLLDEKGSKIERLEFALPVIDKEQMKAIAEVYPNPATEICNIQLKSDRSQQYELMIFDQMGRKAIQQIIHVNEGFQIIPMNISLLNPGYYSIKIYDPNSNTIVGNSKFIKL